MTAESRSLFQDVLQGAEGVSSFYATRPELPSLIARGNVEPRALVDADFDRMISFNSLPFTDQNALEAQVAKLRDPNCLVIMTGQQAGLLLGPLFTTLKALHAIKLAKRLEQETGKPAVPIFWIASDDHDFDEIKSVSWTTGSGAREHFALQLPSSCEGHSVGPMPLDHSAIDALIDQIVSTCPETEHRDEIIGLIREASADSKTIAMMFDRLLLRILQPLGLLAVNPWFTAIRRHLPEILETEITHPGERTQIILETNTRLEEVGYTPQVFRREGDLNLFQYVEDMRCRMVKNGDRFESLSPIDGSVVLSQSAEEVINAMNDLMRFSPNVVTKPLIRDRVFQPVAYIAGPGEMAYYAQFGDVYRAAGIPMPAIVPRAGATLVNAPLKRALKKLNIDPEQWIGMSPAQRRDHIASLGEAGEMLSVLDAKSKAVLSEIDSLQESVVNFDPSLRKSTERLTSSVEKGLDKLRSQMSRSAQTRDEQIASAALRASEGLTPHDSPQERVDNLFVPHLIQHGMGLIDDLLECIDVDQPGHTVLDLTKGT